MQATQNTKLLLEPFDFEANVNYWTFSPFSLSLFQQTTGSSQRGEQEILYTLLPLWIRSTQWKSSLSFLIVFGSHNKELDYKLNISSNVLSSFGGNLDSSHREK